MHDDEASTVEPGIQQTVQTSPFFTQLNYDVRLIVYDHLYEHLPPLAYKKWSEPEDNCRGMIISCKQANHVSILTLDHLGDC